MSRRFLGIAVAGMAVLLALTAAAQPARVPAPERNVETGLVFPATLGPARKVGSNDYAATTGKPALGYAWNYETQFQQATSDIETGARAGRYEQLKPSQGPANCTVGAAVFRCVTFSAIQPSDKRPVFTRLFVTGYRNYFLKIRQDWPQDSPTAARDVDAAVQSLVNSAKP